MKEIAASMARVSDQVMPAGVSLTTLSTSSVPPQAAAITRRVMSFRRTHEILDSVETSASTHSGMSALELNLYFIADGLREDHAGVLGNAG
jgi:hypothetical protein